MCSPGLHFREIKRRLGLANGTLNYHLMMLMKSGTIELEHDGHYIRFYPTSLIHEERTLISILRQPRQRAIVTFLLQHPEADYCAIVRELKLSPSTIVWYLKRLEQSGVVKCERKSGCRSVCFGIAEPEKMIKILSTYKLSFLDKAVDRFLATWESIGTE
jgi:predicted transcriptional regulator